MPSIDETGPQSDGLAEGISHSGNSPEGVARSCISPGVLAEVRELHRRNAEHLSDGRRLRARRDDILTSAAAVGARLIRDGVHRDPAALAELAVSVGVAFDGRSLREPTTVLARAVLGPGRSRNAYTTVGRAAAFAASSRGNDLDAAIRAAGGVTGAAARYGTPHRPSGPGPKPQSPPPAAEKVRVIAAAGVLAAIPAGPVPCHAIIRRAGEGAIELLLVAGRRAHARLSLGPASPDGAEAGGSGRWRALRPSHLGVADGMHVAVAECTPAVCEAVCAGEAVVLAVAAGGGAAGLAEGLPTVPAASPGSGVRAPRPNGVARPRRSVQLALPTT